MKLFIIRLLANLRDSYFYTKFFLAFLISKQDDETILFDSYAGLAFNDNPKAIFDYLNNTNYKLIWVFKSQKLINEFETLYPQYKAIKYNSFIHYRYLNKARTWIFNYKTPPYFIKRKKTKFLQTWHGIPLKKLGCDIDDKKQRFYRSQQSYAKMSSTYCNEGQKIDYFIAPSNYAKEKFISAFNLDPTKIIETAYPRNIILDIAKINLIKRNLKIDCSKKIILYAPTWRDDSSNLNGYINSFILNFKELEESLANDYQIIYRPHYLIKQKNNNFSNQFVIDASNYSSINDLYNIADILVTDYSSVYFDFSIFNRPMYFYMPDLENYKDNLRDFYVNIDTDLPNDYYLNQKELVNAILNNNINQSKLKNFLINNSNYKLDIDTILKKLDL